MKLDAFHLGTHLLGATLASSIWGTIFVGTGFVWLTVATGLLSFLFLFYTLIGTGQQEELDILHLHTYLTGGALASSIWGVCYLGPMRGLIITLFLSAITSLIFLLAPLFYRKT